MFKFWKKKSINQINIIAILFAGIFAFTAAFIVIFNEYIEFQKDLTLTDENYRKSQRKLVVEQTVRLDRLISYRLESLKDKSYSELTDTLSEEIGAILDDTNSPQYIFVYEKDGTPIYESSHYKHSKKIIQKLLVVAQESVGFLTFMSNEQNNIAYARVFNDLDWVIGAGMNMNEKDVVLAQKKERYRQKISGFILKISTLTLFLYMASILKYRYITDKLSKEIKFIVKSLQNAATNYQFIDRSQISFEEFREITSQANNMLIKLKEKKWAVEDLNRNLENLVEEKTEELQKSVEYSQELLVQQEKFLKNAIHELNTPLSIILMNIELYNLRHEKSPYLMKIEAAVKVLENIYGDLSYIVKKDRVEQRLDMMNFTEFIQSRVDYFSDVATGNKLFIKSEIDADIFILFNEFELQRLCDNNLSNAIKYSHMNETIYVRLYRQDGCTIFEVENKGEVIVSVDDLFTRYYREDEARGGFGLGLNIVHEICEKNSVKITVKSNEKRTVFRYYFESSRRIT